MDKNCRNCRKFGAKLFLKGDRCISAKCAFTRRTNPPGTVPLKKQNIRRIKKSEYGIQLQEKQKAKSEYGIRETQFKNIFKKSARSKGATGETLLQMLELRLDNVIYRLGWSSSRKQARQLVGHRHIKINGKIVSIPSLLVKTKDVIEPVKINVIKDNIKEKVSLPKWIKSNKNMQAEILSKPSREEIDTPIDEQLIVEYYSR